MNKKLFWKYVLPSIIAIALPIGAMAQTADVELPAVDSPDWVVDIGEALSSGSGVLDAAVILDVDTGTKGIIYFADSATTFDLVSTHEVSADYLFKLPSITLTGVSSTSTRGNAAVLALDTTAAESFELGSIFITGDSDATMHGFLFNGVSFTGKIEAGTVTVNNGNGNAIAACFWDTSDIADIGAGADITFSKIIVGEEATPSTGDAWGFWANNVDATAGIKITNGVEVYATGKAAGLRFGINPNDAVVAGTLAVGDITVKAGTEAVGVAVKGTFNSIGSQFGEINVMSTAGNAYGIWTDDGNLTATLSENITANGAVDAIGVMINGNATITIDGKVKISATGTTGNSFGIETTGDLILNFTTNLTDTLTSSSTVVDGALNIVDGYADLGNLHMRGDGNITVGATSTLAFDVAASNLGGGTKTVNDGGKVAVYMMGTQHWDPNEGDWTTTQVGDVIYDFSDGAYKWDFENAGVATDYTLAVFNASKGANLIIGADGTVTFGGALDFVNMGDGRVAALGMHNRYAAWNAVRDHMISGDGNGNRAGYFGQAPCDAIGCDPCDPVCGDCTRRPTANIGRAAWANYTARNDTYKSGFAGNNGANWKLSSEGVQAGADVFRTKRGQFGVLFGYEAARSHVALDKVKADDTYVGLYGARVLRNGADIRASFAYGWQDYKMDRMDFDGLYKSAFKGNTTETNVELGKRYGRGLWSLRPVVGVDVMTNDLKAAAETSVGGQGNLGVVYNKTSLTQVFARSGAELRYQRNRTTVNGGVFYAYNMNDKGYDVRANQMAMNSTKLGRELLTANLGATYQLSSCLSLFGGYEGQFVLDGGTKSATNIGYAGAGFKW